MADLIPAPERYRGTVEPLDPRCGDGTCRQCGAWAAHERVRFPKRPPPGTWAELIARLVAGEGRAPSDGPGAAFGDVRHALSVCGRRELWHVTECRDVQLVSRQVGDAGTNWGLPRGLAAAGRHVVLGPYAGCFVAPGFSRVALSVPFIRPDPVVGTVVGATTLDVPPPMHLEIRMGDEGAVARVARAVWSPTSWQDGQYLLEVTGHLATRVEVWGYVETVLVADVQVQVPYWAKFNLLIDRAGTGAPNVTYNALANCVADVS